MAYPDDPLDPRLTEVHRQLCARRLADLRMDYAILDAWNAGVTIRDIAAAARLPQDTVTSKVQSLPTELPPVIEGRLGRRPLEVAARYAVGEISWEQARDDLVSWPYVEEAELPEGFDDSFEVRPGAASEVHDAYSMYGFLAATEYFEISNGIDRHEQADGLE